MIARMHDGFREYFSNKTDKNRFNLYLIVYGIKHKDHEDITKTERIIARTEQIVKKYIQDKVRKKGWEWDKNTYKKNNEFVAFRILNKTLAEVVLVD